MQNNHVHVRNCILVHDVCVLHMHMVYNIRTCTMYNVYTCIYICNACSNYMYNCAVLVYMYMYMYVCIGTCRLGSNSYIFQGNV